MSSRGPVREVVAREMASADSAVVLSPPKPMLVMPFYGMGHDKHVNHKTVTYSARS